MTRMRVCTIGWKPGVSPNLRIVGVCGPKEDNRQTSPSKHFLLAGKIGAYNLELGGIIKIPAGAKEFKGKL